MNATSAGWLEVMEREYLRDFIREGGAAVKFLVPQTEQNRVELRGGLEAAARRYGFEFAFVDAATTRIHLIDRLFHEVARQLNWNGLAFGFLTHLLSESGV